YRRVNDFVRKGKMVHHPKDDGLGRICGLLRRSQILHALVVGIWGRGFLCLLGRRIMKYYGWGR
ncbi:MAG: hypothetical protein FWD94_07960, partial [Treponema sp.]|nr:hypothetical protein [Treponema sp.]